MKQIVIYGEGLNPPSKKACPQNLRFPNLLRAFSLLTGILLKVVKF
jgi:hypothetical protein